MLSLNTSSQGVGQFSGKVEMAWEQLGVSWTDGGRQPESQSRMQKHVGVQQEGLPAAGLS